MSEHTTRRVSPRRRQIDAVAKWALYAAGVLGFAFVLLEVLVGDEATGVKRAIELVTGVALVVAIVVGSLSLAVGYVGFSARGYWAPGDRGLPPWGHRARLLSRVGIRMFWVAVGVYLALALTVLIGMSMDLDEGFWETLLAVPKAVAQGGMMLAILAGLVWVAAELVAGYRERRR